MLRLAVAITLLTAAFAAACPWFGNCCKRRTVYYVPVPPLAAPLAPEKAPEKPTADVFDAAAVYNRVVHSCVMLLTRDRGELVMGSGFLIDANKKQVLTSSRAVPNETVSVVFPIVDKNGVIVNDKNQTVGLLPQGMSYRARVIKRDRARNLALIQLDVMPQGLRLPDLPLAEINGFGTVDVSPDEMLIHIANDAKLDYVFVRLNHKVALLEQREVPRSDQTNEQKLSYAPKIELLQTDGPPSNDTGGPLINKHGQVVGLWDDVKFGIPAVTLHRSISAKEIREFINPRKEQTRDESWRPSTLPAPKDAREREAAELFRRSRLFATGEENRPIYFNKLEELIKKYPDTPAAKEAKKILDAKK